MPRIALLVDYDGKKFHGSQYQLGLRTVQSELERGLATYFRMPLRVILSGRTDSGVHAAGLVVHFDLPAEACALHSDNTTNDLDLWRVCWALNGIMDRDVGVRAAQIVDDSFHARFSARKREYVYRILNHPQRSALLKDTHWFMPHKLDLEAMKASARALLGTHDFIGFRSTNADKSSTICNVARAELFILGEGRLEFWIAADHFVYNMVRIIVGTLMDIGIGKKAPECLGLALSQRDRSLAGPTAPSWGLTLNSVEYPEAYKLFEQDSI